MKPEAGGDPPSFDWRCTGQSFDNRHTSQGLNRLKRPADSVDRNLIGFQPGDLPSLETDLSGVRSFDAADQMEESAFPGSIGTDQSLDRSCLHGHGNPVEGPDSIIFLGDLFNGQEGHHPFFSSLRLFFGM
jgi:hypothetical protein